MKKALPFLIAVVVLLGLAALAYFGWNSWGGKQLFAELTSQVSDEIAPSAASPRTNTSNSTNFGTGGANDDASTYDHPDCDYGKGCGPYKDLPVIPFSDPQKDGLDLYRFAAMGFKIDEAVGRVLGMYNPNNGSVNCADGCTLRLETGKRVVAWTDWCGPAPEGAHPLTEGSTDGGYGLWELDGGHTYKLIKGGYHPALPAGYDNYDFGQFTQYTSRMFGLTPQQSVTELIAIWNEWDGEKKNCEGGCRITVDEGWWVIATDFNGAPPKGAIAAFPASHDYGYGTFFLYLKGTYTVPSGVAIHIK